MESRYNKQIYLEAIKKMKENFQGGIDIAELIEDYEYLDKNNLKIENIDKMQELVEFVYKKISTNNTITNSDIEIFSALNNIADTISTLEKENRFLLDIIKLREICRLLIPLYATNIINREELDNIIVLDNELDKLVPYDKKNLRNRGKYIYINDYITRIASRVLK